MRLVIAEEQRKSTEKIEKELTKMRRSFEEAEG